MMFWEASLRRAAAVMADCRRVLCPLTEFGPFNEGNRQLLWLAGEAGTLEEWPAGENFKNPAGIS